VLSLAALGDDVGELRSTSGEELSLPMRLGDVVRVAAVGRAFKGEL